jgi:hypothetical protein
VHVDALALRGVLEQLGEEDAALGGRPAEDLPRVRADEEHLAARARVRVGERPDGRRDLLLLLVGVGVVAEQEARVQRVVLGLEAGDLLLRALGSASYAARRSANSVLPPQLGSTTACSIE